MLLSSSLGRFRIHQFDPILVLLRAAILCFSFVSWLVLLSMERLSVGLYGRLAAIYVFHAARHSLVYIAPRSSIRK